MICRICKKERKRFRFVCKDCDLVCLKCKDNMAFSCSHSAFTSHMSHTELVGSDWTQRCAQAQKYLPKNSDDCHMISKQILEQKELQDLHIVTNYSVEKTIENVIGLDRERTFAYFRNSEATVITSVEISVEQVSGDDVGCAEFTVELCTESFPMCSTSFCIEKGKKSVTTDWCFLAHAYFNRFSWHVSSKVIDIDNLCIKEEPQYKVIIKTIGATFGGDHCTMFNDSLGNFHKLCPNETIFLPTNVSHYGSCIKKIE